MIIGKKDKKKIKLLKEFAAFYGAMSGMFVQLALLKSISKDEQASEYMDKMFPTIMRITSNTLSEFEDVVIKDISKTKLAKNMQKINPEELFPENEEKVPSVLDKIYS